MRDGSRALPGLAQTARRSLVQQRLAAVQEVLARYGASGVLLDTRADFAWATVGGQNHVDAGSKHGAAPLLVLRDRAIVLAPVNESARIADEELAGLDIEVRSLAWWDGPAAAADELAAGPLLQPSDVALHLERLRSVLSDEEHRRMEWLAEVTRQRVSWVVGSVEAGQAEDDVAANLSAQFARHGIRLPVLLVAADERIVRYRHPLPTATPIGRRLMVVVVAERWGLHVAHTQFAELEPMTPELERTTGALRGVLDEMRAATQAGRTLGDVLRAAQDAYQGRGFEAEWTLHHQGGTIGYQPRERIAVPGDETPILPGMAFAWNPSVTGLKVEETLYLDATGRQHVLTTTPLP